MEKSRSKINHPSIRRIGMKIQSVRHHNVDADIDGLSIGTCVDNFIADCYADGYYPNKLTLEINPPDDDANPERM